MARHPMNDVIVVLPGIMGSVLKKGDDVIWGFTPGSIAQALWTRGGAIAQGLMLHDDDEESETLGDGIHASELLPDLHLMPGFWKIDGYSRLCDMIESRFDVTYGENYFHFPYDWRRSNRAAARRLAHLADGWLRRWRAAGHPTARLILLAHSMGGLVARHYLHVLKGDKDTRALITFGTPYRGAPKALDALANGLRMGPIALDALTQFVRSCTSVYQLLPTYPVLTGGDGPAQRAGEVQGLPHIDATRAAAALAFHAEIRAAAESGPLGYELFPVVGITQATLQSARLDGGRLVAYQHLGGEDLTGDGTVPRVAALPPEHSGGAAMYTAALHGALQNSDAVLDHLEGVITGLSINLGQYLATDRRVPLSLAVPDMLFADDPVPVRVSADQPGRELEARVIDSTSGVQVAAARLADRGDGDYAARFAPLPAGSYRIEVAGDGVQPIADAVGVVGPR